MLKIFTIFLGNDDTWHFLLDRLKWIGLYFGIGFVLISLLRFPYDLVCVIILFILNNVWRGRKLMKKYGGISGIKDMLSTLAANTDRPLKYYCELWKRTPRNCMPKLWLQNEKGWIRSKKSTI